RFRVVQDHLAIAAVGATGEKQDVRRERLDAFDIARSEPVGEGSDQFRAGAEGRASSGFRSELAYQPDRHHAQASGGAARGEPVLEARQATEPSLEIREAFPYA